MNDYVLPSDARQMMTALRFHLRGYVRSNRFYTFLGIFAGFGVATALWLSDPALAPAEYDSPAGLLLAAFAWTAGYFAFALAVVFGSDIVSPDLSSPVGLYTLSQPIRRSTLLLGRFLASYLMAMCCALSLVGVIILTGYVRFGTLPWGALLSMTGLTALLVVAALSFAVMLSSLIRRGSVSILLALILLFVGLPIVSFALSAGHASSWWNITTAANVVIEPATGLLSQSYTPAGGIPSLSIGVITLAAYALVCGVAGVVLFSRRDYAP